MSVIRLSRTRLMSPSLNSFTLSSALLGPFPHPAVSQLRKSCVATTTLMSSIVAEGAKQRKGGKQDPSSTTSTTPNGPTAGTPATGGTANEHQAGNRLHSVVVRTLSSIVLVAIFGIAVYDHLASVVLVFLLQCAVFGEIVALSYAGIEKKKALLVGVNWYFFLLATTYIYLRALVSRFPEYLESSHILQLLYTRQSFIFFMAYMAGFVTFVLSLRKSSLKGQFKQLAYSHMAIIFAVFQSSLFVYNIFEGLIWLILPAACIICNDSLAYVFGMTIGRTRLIKLSPKKTMEGFIGGLISTIILSFFFARILAQFDHMICPRTELFVAPSGCTPDLVFIDQLETINLPFIGEFSFNMMPVQKHALAFALFAGSIAPFGGFFASGLKRALNIKDFSDTIPGHGGFSDRFDCHILMAAFAYVYYTNFVHISVEHVSLLLYKASLLDAAGQAQLLKGLQTLVNGGAN